MATVNVANWSEFVAAVAVSGDTVVCPTKATWDMNELYPEGLSTNITINCAQIEGNGTEIKNLHFYGKFIVNNDIAINSLHITNVVSENEHFIDKGSNARTISMHNCILTGISGLQNRSVIEGPLSITSSTINFNMTASGAGTMYFVHDTFTARYSRITLHYPLSSSTLELNAPLGGISYCMVTVYAPAVTAIISALFNGCVVLGNYGAAIDWHYSYTPHFVSVYDVAAFDDDFEPDSEFFVGVTHEQLYDAEYLASLGFPIGA